MLGAVIILIHAAFDGLIVIFSAYSTIGKTSTTDEYNRDGLT